MVNLLYVTRDILQKIKQHRSYFFWLPIVQNFPLKNIPIEERTFYPRNVEVKNGYIYLTVDMKFVYARDNMFSFLYEDQDLSYRFTAYQGILRTLENKQFSALIGAIAKVVASTDVELVETERVYHPLFDSGAFSLGMPSATVQMNNIESNGSSEPSKVQPQSDDFLKTKRKRGRPRKHPLPSEEPESPPLGTDAKLPKKRGRKPASLETAPTPSGSDDSSQLILGKYSKSLCDEIYMFREKTQKNYDFMSTKFGIEAKGAKKNYQRISKGRTKNLISSPSGELHLMTIDQFEI